jgi:hypothetical protein
LSFNGDPPNCNPNRFFEKEYVQPICYDYKRYFCKDSKLTITKYKDEECKESSNEYTNTINTCPKDNTTTSFILNGCIEEPSKLFIK